jgi:quinolinate synthase
VHERVRAKDVSQLRTDHPGVVVLAHPEYSPDVVAAADFAGSTAAMSDYVATRKSPRVVLLTECSMSDNVAVLHLGIDFIRPSNLCPHMKRTTLAKIRSALEEMRHEVTIDPAVAAPARPVVERVHAL